VELLPFLGQWVEPQGRPPPNSQDQAPPYYDQSFKQKAVELADARGNARELAEELGISANLIYRWRREALQFGTGSFQNAAATME
jgi:transposase-like protein